MKKKSVIYGVNGFLEYQALIKVGNAKIKIDFTNGSTNETGRTPASYVTSNPFVQMAIENSKEFKSGLIRIVHSSSTNEDVYIESDNVALQESEATAEVVEDKSNEAEVPNAPAENTDTANTEDNGETEDTGLLKKEFASRDDAKDFLEQEFGVARSKMRSKNDIIALGKANGIEVVLNE